MRTQCLPSPDFDPSKLHRGRLQDGYNERYNELLKSAPYTPDCIGKRNPYSGNIVRSKPDYEKYLQQRAYLETLKVLMEQSHDAEVQLEALAKAKALTEDYELRAIQAEQKARSLGKSLADANTQLNTLASEKKHYRRSNNVLRCLFCVALAFISLVSFVLLPKARNASYELGSRYGDDSGYNRGYSEGQADGREEGYHEGYSTGKTDGYDEGVVVGYQDGYDDGLHDGLAEASPGDSPSPSITSVSIPYGHFADEIVYVSKRSGTIHSVSTCSGMKYYTRMTLEEALVNGFTHYCEHCF